MTTPLRAPLSATEEAYLVMVADEYTAAVQAASAQRNQRTAVLLTDKGIPLDSNVEVEPRTKDGPAHLVFVPSSHPVEG